MRDVRDYKVASGGPDSLGTSSPFNIKRESLTVRNFDRTAIAALFGQHTAQIGQVFSPAATDRVLELTASQPHLVNSLADEVVRNQPWQLTVEVPHVDAAKEALILRWGTHFDSLMAPLREDRLRRVVEPRVASASPRPVAFEDERYCRDLGPIDGSPPMIANAIYRELIPGFLTRDHQLGMARLRWSKWAST
ncbi:MAG: hypothetical protein EXR77_19145 [Myxococcales bacterium]|nr:hypothetical protein [Myxococcales bacterium]